MGGIVTGLPRVSSQHDCQARGVGQLVYNQVIDLSYAPNRTGRIWNPKPQMHQPQISSSGMELSCLSNQVLAAEPFQALKAGSLL